MYKTGKAPFYEKGLDVLVRNNYREGKLKFTTSIAEGIKEAEAIIIAVGTPPKEDGYPDLSFVENVAKQIGQSLDHYAPIIEKSTVPVRTAEWMDTILSKHLDHKLYDIAACPEFLRESTAVPDFMKPDRIVMGANSPRADQVLVQLYKPITAPVLHTNIKEAEVIKHASNAYLFMKITFAYSLSQLCDAEGDMDAEIILRGVGMDKRIGPDFLQLGPGVGGMCFPKDLDAFIAIYRQFGVDSSLFEAVRKINYLQKQQVANKVIHAFDGDISDRTIGVWGLAFKAGTDDMRMAASIDIITQLQKKGAKIIAYDPKAMAEAKRVLPDITYAESADRVLEKSNALLVLTEWQEFIDTDPMQLREKISIVIDGRNIFQTKRMLELGYKYDSMGKPIKRLLK